MIKTRLMFATVFSVMVLALTFITTTRTISAAAPTFSKDVAPIIYKNCASCHRPGDIAPMSLLTYENARPWAKAIREQVATRQMPPWHATQPHGTFLNDRRLSDADRDTLIRWADGGALKGDPKDLPPMPKFSDNWEIGTPDVVLSMSQDYEVPDSGAVAYQYFQVPTNFTEDKWVQAIEVRPGSRSVVHHILVFCREPKATPRAMGYVSVVPKMNQRSTRNDNLIGTTAPGTNAMIFRPGTALRVKAGSVLVLQMHYTTNGAAAKDKSSVGMIFAKQAPQLEMRTSAFVNPMFVIPPGANNYQVDSAIEFTEDAHIWGLIPHTHLRGKSWEYTIVYPDGRAESVLSVPKYDFNWQTYYLFAKPIAVPKGTRLEAIAHYDNSTANAFNPNPEAQVRWGDQTWEEMQYTGITYSIDNNPVQPSPEAARKEQK
ncbi:MAG TPA: thiol-disulfide isomerase [Blastocatellia bacterium]|nr:thiol-disulfide isomerase [Blastocatellia bacterium]